MTRASKAALLSGLVFPGAGHLLLRRYLRGSALILFALLASSIIIKSLFRRALAVVDQITGSDVPVEVGQIAEMVAQSSIRANGLAENAPLVILLACWLIGVIDSYRIGTAEKRAT